MRFYHQDNLMSRDYYYSPFTQEETEAESEGDNFPKATQMLSDRTGA